MLMFVSHTCEVSFTLTDNIKSDKVFKRGLTKFFKGCSPQNLLSQFLNTFSQM